MIVVAVTLFFSTGEPPRKFQYERRELMFCEQIDRDYTSRLIVSQVKYLKAYKAVVDCRKLPMIE